MTNKAKYETRNPIKKALLRRFLTRLHETVSGLPGKVLDAGVGEGLFWEGLDSRRVVGVDIRPDALADARKRFDGPLLLASIDALPFEAGSFDSTVAIEILEHLAGPEDAIRELDRVTRSRVVVSVPWEPWFSLLVLAGSGRHWRRLGREPEHVQAFGPRDLASLLESRFGEVQVRTCFPWIVAQASRTHR